MLARSLRTLTRPLVVHKTGGIVHFELNRAEKRNALTLQMGEALIEAAEAISKDASVRAVVVSGSGPSFCTGRDLKISASHNEEQQAEEYLKTALHSVLAIFNLPVPVVAAVHGHALGYGLELAMACDIKVFHPNTESSFPETSLGIFPGAGGAVLAPLLFGEGKALDWILSGRKIYPDEGLACGLISSVNDLPLEKAMQIAQQLSTRPPLGLRAAKAVVKRRVNRDLDDWVQEAHEQRSRLGLTCDHREALQAFVEKRAPVFTGQ